MNNTSESFLQEVLDDNEQIHQSISNQLKIARSQILVATSWFTDPDLFQLLLQAIERDVDVRVIMIENDDNKKLDFEKLERVGAVIYKVRQSGYRGMRKLFCIIDQETAIHGSYNWTVNARLNNQQSVIVTNHTDTVKSLIDQFMQMEAAILNGDDTAASVPGLKTEKEERNLSPEKMDSSTLSGFSKLNFQTEYANVLDRMIAAEVFNFDRSLLRQQGYERAKANNGDAQILSNAMDSLYSVFINDVNIVEDKKKRLTGKISEQKIVHTGSLENNFHVQLRTIETQSESIRQETNVRAANLRAKVEVNKIDIASIQNQKLVTAELQAKEIEARINLLEQESVVPGFKWYEFIPTLILSIGLFFYLLLFYSSAVYILLFSESRAKEAQINGTGAFYNPPQVFEPKAFSYILTEGGYAVSFVCLFIFIPLALSVITRLAKGSMLSKAWVSISLTVLLDIGIAYKVAASIHEANYLAGNATEAWQLKMIFFESNFYLVFLLGSLGLLIFNALFNKLLNLFEERNPDVQALQVELKKQQEKVFLNESRQHIAALNENVETLNKEVIRIDNEVHLAEAEIASLSHKKSLAIEQCTIDFENSKKTLGDITAVYISHIENDILPISIDSMRDRINVFLEGWTSFLFDEYADLRAIEKSRQAIEAATIWQQKKLSGDRIDNRIKAL